MMTFYMKSGNRYDVTPEANIQIAKKLPVGTYTVGLDPRTGAYYLEVIDDLSFKGKIYGDTMQRAERILNTFNDRPRTTGVLLAGEKGSGKTLLAKMLSILGREQGIITIVINAAWAGEPFNMFMQNIEQPTIVVFDEFEKVYDDDGQKAVLTLLDGTYSSKKMFVVTTNDRFGVSPFMINRPGRFFYALNYRGLQEEFIREYCLDNLTDPDRYIEDIVRLAHTFNAFNFDMLQAIIEELNRYKEDLKQAIAWLNISSDNNNATYEIVSFELKGKVLEGFKPASDICDGRSVSITEGFWAKYRFFDNEYYKEALADDPKAKKEDYMDDGLIRFDFEDVKSYEKSGVIFAENDEAKITFVKKYAREYSMMDLL